MIGSGFFGTAGARRQIEDAQKSDTAWGFYADELHRKHTRGAHFDADGLKKDLLLIKASVGPERQASFVQHMLDEDRYRPVKLSLDVFNAVRDDGRLMRHLLRRAADRGSEPLFGMIHDAAPDKFENSSLFMAVQRGLPLARREIGSQDDLRETDGDGNTMLHHAAFNRDVVTFAKLLDASKKQGLQAPGNVNGETPLHLLMAGLSKRRSTGLRNFVIPDESLDAARQIVRLATEAGHSLNAQDKVGETPMHRFGRERVDAFMPTPNSGHQLVTAFLTDMVEKGADLSLKDTAGKGLIEKAHEGARTECSHRVTMSKIATFLSLNVRPNDISDPSLLRACLIEGSSKGLLALESMGSTWRDDMGGEYAAFSAVLQAQSNKSAAPIEAMKGAGVSFDVRNDRGESPLSLAVDLGLGETSLDLLRKIKREQVEADIAEKVAKRRVAMTSQKSTFDRSPDAR